MKTLIKAFTLLACALVLTACATTGEQREGQQKDNDLVYSVDAELIIALLGEEGFTGARIDADGDVEVKMRGYTVYIFAMSEEGFENIHFWFGYVSDDVTLETLNQWNKEKYLVKAYLDDDGDPILEMDTDITGGVTRARIKDSITSFDFFLGQFLNEVLEGTQSDSSRESGWM